MEPNQSYGKRMWYLWGPVVIKFGIAYLIYVIVTAGLMVAYTSVKTGGDADAMMAIFESQTQIQQMYEAVLTQLYSYAVPIEGAAALVTIPLMAFFFHRDRTKEKKAGITIYKKAPLWKYAGIIVISATMSMALNNLILISHMSEMSESYEKIMEAFYEPSFLMQIVCLGIVIPICEEMVYRGLMFRRMRGQTKFLQAALYSSVVFAITHGNVVQMLYGFFMGMLLAYLYEKYGSVKAPILGHITANLLSVVGTNYNLFGWLMKEPMRMGIVTVACASLAATAFVWIRRIEAE